MFDSNELFCMSLSEMGLIGIGVGGSWLLDGINGLAKGYLSECLAGLWCSTGVDWCFF